MQLLSSLLTALVAIEHLYILWMEMFAWTTAGKKTFKNFPSDLFEKTKVLAANQGLYNGFLAAGLVWSLIISDAVWGNYIAYFFLGCVIIAGIYGAITASRKIFVVQAVPAIIALGVRLYLSFLH